MKGGTLMQTMNRREERRQVLYLLFETLFREDEVPEAIYSNARDERQIPESKYIEETYFGVQKNLETIDGEINSHAKGRSASQMTKITRSILRLAVYEILFCDDINGVFSINEAVELTKEFEDVKVKGFVNGILNAIYQDTKSKESNDKKDSDDGENA